MKSCMTTERTPSSSSDLNMPPFSTQWIKCDLAVDQRLAAALHLRQWKVKTCGKTDEVCIQSQTGNVIFDKTQKAKKCQKIIKIIGVKRCDLEWGWGPLQLAISCRFKRAWNFITFALFKQITQFVNLKDKLGETRVVLLPCPRRPCFSFIKSPISQHH